MVSLCHIEKADTITYIFKEFIDRHSEACAYSENLVNYNPDNLYRCEIHVKYCLVTSCCKSLTPLPINGCKKGR